MNLGEFTRRIKSDGCPVCHNPCEFKGYEDTVYWDSWQCVNPQCVESEKWHSKYDDLVRIVVERWW